jgi:hypothetical protein
VVLFGLAVAGGLVDFACFSSASAVDWCLSSLEALVALCRLRLLLFLVVPFLGVCVANAESNLIVCACLASWYKCKAAIGCDTCCGKLPLAFSHLSATASSDSSA